jgi:hypothetical protein
VRSVLTSVGWAPCSEGGRKSADCRQIPLRGYQRVDDLPILVYCPVQIPPPPGNLYVHLVCKPAISRAMPTRLGRLDQQRGKPLHPPVRGHVIDRDAARSQQFFNVSIGQSITRVPSTAIVITSGGTETPGSSTSMLAPDEPTTHRPSLPGLVLQGSRSPSASAGQVHFEDVTARSTLI